VDDDNSFEIEGEELVGGEWRKVIARIVLNEDGTATIVNPDGTRFKLTRETVAKVFGSYGNLDDPNFNLE
jgi:hypothetical protein